MKKIEHNLPTFFNEETQSFLSKFESISEYLTPRLYYYPTAKMLFFDETSDSLLDEYKLQDYNTIEEKLLRLIDFLLLNVQPPTIHDSDVSTMELFPGISEIPSLRQALYSLNIVPSTIALLWEKSSPNPDLRELLSGLISAASVTLASVDKIISRMLSAIKHPSDPVQETAFKMMKMTSRLGKQSIEEFLREHALYVPEGLENDKVILTEFRSVLGIEKVDPRKLTSDVRVQVDETEGPYKFKGFYICTCGKCGAQWDAHVLDFDDGQIQDKTTVGPTEKCPKCKSTDVTKEFHERMKGI